MSGTEGQTNVNSNLQKQDLANLDINKLTPLSPEVISRQATINIGTIGHVAHGKSTVVKAISGVQTVRFKNELERNITIKLERLSSETIIDLTSSPSKLRDFMKKRYEKDQNQKRRKLIERVSNNSSPTCSSTISLSSCSSSGYESLMDVGNDFKISEMLMKSIKVFKKKEHEFNVEKILSIQVHKNRPLFNVKWRGYPHSENTWEPIKNLYDCHLFEKFINEEYNCNKDTIKLITQNVLKEMEDEKFFLNDEDIHVKNVDKFDNYAYTCDLILMAKFGIQGFLHCRVKEIIHDRIKRNSVMKSYHLKRKQQLIEIFEWKESINTIEIKSNINVENFVDYDVPHLSFNYINERIPFDGIIIPDDPPIGCECTEQCNFRSGCCPQMSSTQFAYNSKGRLRLELGMPIFECNRKCKCDATCNNRVVQNGRKNQLCIFKTDNNCGWGVKTEKRICRRQYVCEYVGEVITVEEADRRGKVYDAQGRTYLFDLDFNEDGYCVYTIDGANYGNVSHFINHSCEPNCAIWPVWDNCLDPNLPRLAIFTLRQIEAGEEITFDYICQNSAGRTNDNNTNVIYNNVSDAEKVPCRCGAPSCRKFLF